MPLNLPLPALRPIPDRIDDNPPVVYPIQDNVRSASDHELPHPHVKAIRTD
jgi:hypothetical protein